MPQVTEQSWNGCHYFTAKLSVRINRHHTKVENRPGNSLPAFPLTFYCCLYRGWRSGLAEGRALGKPSDVYETRRRHKGSHGPAQTQRNSRVHSTRGQRQHTINKLQLSSMDPNLACKECSNPNTRVISPVTKLTLLYYSMNKTAPLEGPTHSLCIQLHYALWCT